MSLSTKEYIACLRAIYLQVEALNETESGLPSLQTQEWNTMLDQAFQAVPELKESWMAVGMWMNTMVTMLEQYHTLAEEFLEEEDTLELSTISNYFPETLSEAVYS